ncbi:MAG: hypothetical protein QOI95_4205 [Acidimicrobiaceae bacterium]
MVIIVLCAAVLAVPEVAGAAPRETISRHDMKTMFQTANGEAQSGKGPGKPQTNGISYHGGPVMLGTTKAYVIWYGNWADNTATTILTDLFTSIGGSHYFNINTTYVNGTGGRVSNSVAYGGSTTDAYSRGTALSDAGVQGVVSDAVTAGRLPKDANGVYFVLTSADVNETSGFLTQYCGWHTHGTISGSDLKYSFVGDPTRGMSACAAQGTSPNGNAPADAMASVIAHELEETVTDPDLNAWYDSRGYENADKCAWTFGTTYTTSNGSKANMTLGTRNYLIQRNWLNASGGLCALTY